MLRAKNYEYLAGMVVKFFHPQLLIVGSTDFTSVVVDEVHIRAVFNCVSKVITFLLWFCITTLCDWLIKLAPLSQPIRCKTKTNRASLAHVFPRLAFVTCICFEF